MVVKNFVFFDETSTSDISNALVNESYGRNVTLQVSNITQSPTFSVTVEGLSDLARPNDYQPLAMVSLDDLGVVQSITSEGLYVFSTDGIYKIRLRCSSGRGTFKAYANLTD